MSTSASAATPLPPGKPWSSSGNKSWTYIAGQSHDGNPRLMRASTQAP